MSPMIPANASGPRGSPNGPVVGGSVGASGPEVSSSSPAPGSSSALEGAGERLEHGSEGVEVQPGPVAATQDLHGRTGRERDARLADDVGERRPGEVLELGPFARLGRTVALAGDHGGDLGGDLPVHRTRRLEHAHQALDVDLGEVERRAPTGSPIGSLGIVAGL